MDGRRLLLPFFIMLIVSPIFSEVSTILLSEIKREQIAILQYDSRPLAGYWLVSAKWNQLYASNHGHKFLYYSLPNNKCVYGEVELAHPWCKVKAMIQASADFPDIRLFIYMDSDALIDKIYRNTSLNQILQFVQEKLNWDPIQKPLVFNQDGPCWWCKLIEKVGYKMCLNAGTVLWYRNPQSIKLLEDWWHASMEPYDGNPLNRHVIEFIKLHIK